MKHVKKLFALIIVLALLVSSVSIFASAASSFHVSPLAYGAAEVTASKLNVRNGAGTSFEIKGSLAKGSIVVVLEKTSKDWYKINYHGLEGYVSTEYLGDIKVAEDFKAAGTVVGSGVRMRSGPSVSKSLVAGVKDGDVLQIIGINNGWYKCVYMDATGYIRSDLMTITGAYVPGDSAELGQQIADFALQFVGYAYVYGCESPSTGFDCSGLVYYTYGQFGYELSRTASQQYKNNGTKIEKEDLQPGDLCFFSSYGSGVTHVGIYIGDGKFVHASTSNTGVIISELDSSYYTRVWYAAKRIV